ncbi:MAG: argininosuccinate synthase [Sulfolobales archaeon]|nr:argininosuccinate synthase [Sulfolobales archaeon]
MKVVLAYSGGLDTSVILLLLRERLNAEVVTLTVDVGQEDDLDEVAHKAEKLGAVKHYSIDCKEEFVDKYVFPALKANALYQGKYPLSSALSRPLISSKLVEIAKKEGADAVAHGCSGKGNDQVRFDLTVKALDPTIKVLAPVRDWGLNRDWEYEYAKSKGIKFSVKFFSVDDNLWGRSIECGILDDPMVEPPEEVFKWTLPLAKARNEPEYVTITFENGIPIAINDEKLDRVQIIKTLNTIAGRNGVGRIDHIEDRVVGLKSREVYECPAAVTLIESHKDLEKLVLTKWELMFKESVENMWTNLVYSGLWVEPLKNDLEAFIESTQKRVNGSVKLKLFKGSVSVVGRSSNNSLYDPKLTTYESHTILTQEHAKGFIELWGLQSVVAFRKLLGNYGAGRS